MAHSLILAITGGFVGLVTLATTDTWGTPASGCCAVLFGLLARARSCSAPGGALWVSGGGDSGAQLIGLLLMERANRRRLWAALTVVLVALAAIPLDAPSGRPGPRLGAGFHAHFLGLWRSVG